ncbi:MAG: hypothetical protein DMG71_01290 [Acidobacteria bacterium]|nr:MAG: hypothetical protein DMG71_01290 [Acidobacteriota bacterium]
MDFDYDGLQDTYCSSQTQTERQRKCGSRVNTPMHFDQFAADYKQVLDKNVALSGEDSEYFAEYKARYLARRLSPDFTGKILDFGCGVGLLSRSLKKNLPAAKLDGYQLY